MSGRQYESPLGSKGQFYFDSIPAGRYPASVDFSSGTCKFEIEITKSDKPSLKLADQTCVLTITANAAIPLASASIASSPAAINTPSATTTPSVASGPAAASIK